MCKRKSLSDLYEEYRLKYNGKPKHEFGHFIKVMAMYEHHRTVIRPRIKWWQELRKVDKSIINPKMINSKMEGKRNYVTLTTVLTLIVTAIITYFGRIYFPENFHPETTPFIENYMILNFMLYFVVLLGGASLLILKWVGNELVKDIKSLFKI